MNLWNKDQLEILEVKNTITEISNSIDGLNSRLDTAEERISKLKERPVENSQIESQGEKKKRMENTEKSQRDTWDTMKRCKIDVIWSPRKRGEREKDRGSIWRKKKFSFEINKTLFLYKPQTE